MQQGMGSTFGSSSRSLPGGKRPSARTQTFPQMSLRAVAYALEATSPSCSTASASIPRVDRGDSASSGTLMATRTAWGPTVAFGPPHPCVPFQRSRRSWEAKAIKAGPPRSLGAPLVPVRQAGRRRGQILPLPALPASAAAEADMEVPFTSDSGLAVTVRKIRTLDELRQVATLRAEAYYAENQSRFVGSLKKKFVEQEVESLQQRTTIMSRQGTPYSECLVAIDTVSGPVLACIDMRLPAALNGTHPHGVPQDDPNGCYLLNVVVREDVRGQGLGRGVMRAAMARAVHVWGSGQLYTHVEADNEVAFRLYRGCGFDQHSTDSKYEAASKLGQTVLLQAAAEAAPAL